MPRFNEGGDSTTIAERIDLEREERHRSKLLQMFGADYLKSRNLYEDFLDYAEAEYEKIPQPPKHEFTD